MPVTREKAETKTQFADKSAIQLAYNITTLAKIVHTYLLITSHQRVVTLAKACLPLSPGSVIWYGRAKWQ